MFLFIQGDPVCDSYRIQTYENGAICCIADGTLANPLLH